MPDLGVPEPNDPKRGSKRGPKYDPKRGHFGGQKGVRLSKAFRWYLTIYPQMTLFGVQDAKYVI